LVGLPVAVLEDESGSYLIAFESEPHGCANAVTTSAHGIRSLPAMSAM